MRLLLRTIKNGLALLFKGDLREIGVRARIVLGQIDLKNVTTEELNLPADRAHSYADSGGDALESVFSAFRITPADSVIDFGSGKGGALITLAKFPFGRITGVEMSPVLAEIARKNLALLKIDCVDIVCCDATLYGELDRYNYVYLFNPFPGQVMRGVIRNLEESVARHPRKVTIVYLNPVCHEEVVAGSVFYKVKELDHPEHAYFVYANRSRSRSGNRPVAGFGRPMDNVHTKEACRQVEVRYVG